MEYVGAGFEAGECGVRFHNLLATDAGTWSCTVGLHNDTAVEQRVSFSVSIDREYSKTLFNIVKIKKILTYILLL